MALACLPVQILLRKGLLCKNPSTPGVDSGPEYWPWHAARKGERGISPCLLSRNLCLNSLQELDWLSLLAPHRCACVHVWVHVCVCPVCMNVCVCAWLCVYVCTGVHMSVWVWGSLIDARNLPPSLTFYTDTTPCDRLRLHLQIPPYPPWCHCFNIKIVGNKYLIHNNYLILSNINNKNVYEIP